MKNLIKKLVIGLIAGCIATSPVKAETFGSAEIMAGNAGIVTDVKLSVDIAPRTGLFGRQTNKINYDAKESPFGLGDLTFNLYEGLDVVGEVQFAGSVIPRIGLEYFKKIGDAGFFVEGTINVDKPNNFELTTSATYTPEISDSKKLYLSLEDITNIGLNGHNFSLQRAKAGIEIGGVRAGLAAALSEPGTKDMLDYNLGAFVTKKF